MHGERKDGPSIKLYFQTAYFISHSSAEICRLLYENINVTDNPSVCVFVHHNEISHPNRIYWCCLFCSFNWQKYLLRVQEPLIFSAVLKTVHYSSILSGIWIKFTFSFLRINITHLRPDLPLAFSDHLLRLQYLQYNRLLPAFRTFIWSS